MISVDSYGWIERLTNGPKADLYNAVIDKAAPSEIVTSAMVLYEVYGKIKRVVNEQSALVAVSSLGYTSRAEFIKESVRLRVEAMENLLRENAKRAD